MSAYVERHKIVWSLNTTQMWEADLFMSGARNLLMYLNDVAIW
jgi:hypothetical protein